MEYKASAIEKKWQQNWEENHAYRVEIDKSKPKYYVLDMFPYPSGAGLHVGHPIGYIASDIFSRYKRAKGFNVLHPMGFDAFGLPAEQYAIETGQHPAKTTHDNINVYKKQLKNLGFSYDWSREVQTSDPQYYKWTQWIFMKLFASWYNQDKDSANSIENLVAEFEKSGNGNVNAATSQEEIFTADDWKAMSRKEQSDVLMKYRLAYQSYSDVNWCPELGTVLANDEVKDGVSERGGHPVIKKTMRQWFLRTTAYAERLLTGMENLDWFDSMKEMQRNWIGRSEGAAVVFKTDDSAHEINIFTTRPDTIYGATFMVLAPEHDLVDKITTKEQQQEIEDYKNYVQSRSERDRISDVKKVTGAFTGAYAINPFTNTKIPIWISEYVLAGYGTGAIMAVPSDDLRDKAFAEHFDLPIVEVIDRTDYPNAGPEDKIGKMINSGPLDGLEVKDAIQTILSKIEEMGIGTRKVNYKLRDAGYSRQRYWGEPFPIVYKDGIPELISEDELPLTLPEVESYKPTGSGDSPLASVEDWVKLPDGSIRETDTMPGFAGSNWYYLRYMDPENESEFVSKEAENYWGTVDLYIGGAEHAVGHLIYSRFCYKFLADIDLVSSEEPYQKLVNQGMVGGRSNFVYRIKGTNQFVSHGLREEHDVTPIRVDVNIVKNDKLDLEAFKNWREDFQNAEFILENGEYICGYEWEKMSKSKYNVVNPDDVVERYGADTMRMYEMFLGPIEMAKPWDTNGIDGVYRFLNKVWRLFFSENGDFQVTDQAPTDSELKTLHKTIKKVGEDIERLSFNTAVSAFMVCANELHAAKCYKREILEQLLRVLSPFAPHICEELWGALGKETLIVKEPFPQFEEKYLKEANILYPVSVNGKMRLKLELPADMGKDEVEQIALSHETVQRWMEGKSPKKVIVVPGRIVNVVV